MTEPKRILDDDGADATARSLLRAAKDWSPPDSARTRSLAALGLATTGATVTKAVGGAAIVKLLFGSKTSLGMLILGTFAVAGTAVAVSAMRAPVAPPPTSVPIVTTSAPPTDSTPSTPTAIVAPPTASAEPSVVPSAPIAPAPRASAPAVTSEADADTMADELAVLDRVRGLQAAGDSRGALALLDDYDHRYPSGHLRMEAEVVRIETLAKSGDRARASTRAASFLAAHPHSLLTPRVRAIQASLDAGSP
jgi:hypothetical protein